MRTADIRVFFALYRGMLDGMRSNNWFEIGSVKTCISPPEGDCVLSRAQRD
jgi:hypothetical protein